MPSISDKEVAYYATFITGHPDAEPGPQHLAAARAVLEGLVKDDRLIEAPSWSAPTPLVSDYTAIVRREDVPAPKLSRAEIMALVRQYALARIVANVSTPTKRQRDNTTIVELHERDRREVDRLEKAIDAALRTAGLS